MAETLYKSVRTVRRILREKYGLSAVQSRAAVFSSLLLDSLLPLCGHEGYQRPAAYDLLMQSLDSRISFIEDSLPLLSICDPLITEHMRADADNLRKDPLLIGWAYQIWNEELRDTSTWAVSKRGETTPDDRDIPIATQLFSEEYMTEYLIRLSMIGCAVERYELFDPACGVGHFLVQGIRSVYREAHSKDAVIDFVQRGLFGVDIDQDVIDVCRLIVLAESLKVDRTKAHLLWRSIKSNIHSLNGPEGTLNRLSNEELLQRRYQCVVTNPPYLGRRKLSEPMRSFLDREYPAASIDLCAAFMQRCIELVEPSGFIGLVTVDKWLRLKGYDSLRKGRGDFLGLCGELTINTIVELGEGAFRSDLKLHDGVGIVLLAAHRKEPPAEHSIAVVDCTAALGPAEKSVFLSKPIADSQPCDVTVRAIEQRAFGSAAMSQFAYLGVPGALRRSCRTVGDSAQVVVGLQTNDDARFVRMYWEVPPDRSRWIIHSKGGGYGRWYGLNRYILDWGTGRSEFEQRPSSGISVERWFGEQGWSYTWFANGCLGLRRKERGWSLGRAAASGVFCSDERVIALLNSRFGSLCARRIGGKVQLPEGVVRRIPLPSDLQAIDLELVRAAVELKRIIVSGDPTEVSFKPGVDWDPIARFALEGLLLLVEGELELQVSRAVAASDSERAELDSLLAPPASWTAVSCGAIDRLDDLWRYVPKDLAWIKERIPTPCGERARFEFGDTQLLSLLSSSPYRRLNPRMLPCNSRLEYLCRGFGAHPLDVFIALHDRSQGSDSVSRMLHRPGLLLTILESVLASLNHRWWSAESTSIQRASVGERSFDSILSDIEARLSATNRAWGDMSVTMMLGQKLSEWLLNSFARWHGDEFFKKPLAQHQRRSRSDRGVFVHSWDLAPISRI